MTTDPTPESARALLDRHGLPEDVIDGVLCLHAQELAALQRLRMDELDLTGQKARFVGRIVDLIDPTRTAAVPVAAPPTTEQTALRDCIRRALCEAAGFGFAWGTDMLEPDEYGEVADAVLAVLPAPADRAAEARVRALHQEYAFGGDPQVYCAHCNQISGGWIPWPCPTVQALAAEAPHAETPDAEGLPARLEAALTERFTALGNPFSEMRRQEQGPDGWPASRPVGPHQVAEVLRELLAAAPAVVAQPGKEN
ncbi:hypothetical protein [Streptomyces stelliscabiei]|uniref:Uncharacterized protein n=1 Tax=Streptomyces stelliscabiei TaxID=146820 RepID=A0A8I0TRQ8_9ACTN|nr:hypothetical protein [Streptomyces stelliscabiei]KND45324.1 hypothetical protein IQ64_07545 [Streptomyces stelliscabiei]MBE1597171.1 hypothetical protein [Streptomyces stelliscabiei]